MKRKQRAIKEFDFSKYDFSDCVEITGDALYLINGGGTTTESKSDSGNSQGSGKNGSSGGGNEIDNSHEAVANAKPGDYFYRDDGTKQVVNAGDIAYEKNYLQNSGNNDKATQTPETFQSTDAESPTKPASTGGSGGGSDHKGSDSTYTVNKGDTLSKIVYDHNKKYGTKLTVAEVAKNNGIKDPNKIYCGQQINLGLSQTSETQTSTDNFTGYSEATKKKLERDEQRLSPKIPNGQNINSQNVSIGETYSDIRYNAVDYKGQHIMTVQYDDKQKYEDCADYYLTVGQYGAAGTPVYDGIGLKNENGDIIHVFHDGKSVVNYGNNSLGLNLADGIEVNKEVNIGDKHNYTQITNNQNKNQNMGWGNFNLNLTDEEHSLEASGGVYHFDVELNNSDKTHFYAQLGADLANAGLTAEPGHFGFSLNGATVSGQIGAEFFGVRGSVGGSAGASTGLELKFKPNEGLIFDAGFILKPRIEVDWSKRVNENF